MQTPDIPSLRFDTDYQRELAALLPTMNEPEMINLWFVYLPDPARDKASDETDARLYITGIILTEMRRRAIGQRSVERLNRVHVFKDEMEQVTQHLMFRKHQANPNVRAAAQGVIIPGYND